MYNHDIYMRPSIVIIVFHSILYLERGDKGFPLPVIDGVTLVNPKVTSGEVRVLSYDLIMKAIRGDQAF